MDKLKLSLLIFLLIVAFLLSIIAIFFPWYYVIRIQDQVITFQTWNSYGYYTLERLHSIPLNESFTNWADKGFEKVGRTFTFASRLVYIGSGVILFSVVVSLFLLISISICIHRVKRHSTPIKYFYVITNGVSFVVMMTCAMYFINITNTIREDQMLVYKGLPCWEKSPCHSFIGVHDEIYKEWGPAIGWVACLGSSLFCLLALIYSSLARMERKLA